MSEKIRIDIDGNRKLLRQLWTVYGISMAVDALPGVDTANGKLPGAGLVRALLERTVADERASLSSMTLRALAKAGHDISACKSVFTCFEGGGKPYLEAEMYDLADLAGDEANG